MMDVQAQYINQGIQMNYAMSVARKAMDVQEIAAQGIEKMLPDQGSMQAGLPLGKYIDTYA